MLCLSSKALYPWTTKQVSLSFTCSIFWELFRNSRTKCPHIQQPLNHKTIKRLRPLIFCESTVPEIEECKISIPWTSSKEINKLLFLPSKMGGRLIHGIDLYTGKYGSTYEITAVNSVREQCNCTCKQCCAVGLYAMCYSTAKSSSYWKSETLCCIAVITNFVIFLWDMHIFPCITTTTQRSWSLATYVQVWP